MAHSNFASRATLRLAAALLAGSLMGCGAAQDMMGMSNAHLPESPDVENAPWPRLADAPDPVAPINAREPESDLPERKRAAAVNAEMQAEAERLRAEARRLDAETGGDRVVGSGSSDRAAAALANDEAAMKEAGADDAARLRAEIEAELNAAFGEEAKADTAKNDAGAEAAQ